MTKVELVYDSDCPNVDAARAALREAFARANIEPGWQEWRADDPASPAHVRGFGSPAILVNGADVADADNHGDGARCRLYRQSDGSICGAPAAEVIAGALDRAGAAGSPATRTGAWKSHLAMLPGIGAALLPKIACPACWPAYAGLLSAIGLSFLVGTRYLLPLTAGFLAVAMGVLAFRARRRRGYGPFALGLLASVIVLVGKFHWGSDATMYGGLALLVAASLWNTWPGKSSVACSSCEESTTQPVR